MLDWTVLPGGIAVRYWPRLQISEGSTKLDILDGSLTWLATGWEPLLGSSAGAADNTWPLNHGSLTEQIKAPNGSVPATKVEFSWLFMT